MEVLGCVLILRGVAAANVTALEAQTQVNPSVAHLQTLLATFSARSNITNLIEMCARAHGAPPSVVSMVSQKAMHERDGHGALADSRGAALD